MVSEQTHEAEEITEGRAAHRPGDGGTAPTRRPVGHLPLSRTVLVRTPVPELLNCAGAASRVTHARAHACRCFDCLFCIGFNQASPRFAYHDGFAALRSTMAGSSCKNRSKQFVILPRLPTFADLNIKIQVIAPRSYLHNENKQTK